MLDGEMEGDVGSEGRPAVAAAVSSASSEWAASRRGGIGEGREGWGWEREERKVRLCGWFTGILAAGWQASCLAVRWSEPVCYQASAAPTGYKVDQRGEWVWCCLSVHFSVCINLLIPLLRPPNPFFYYLRNSP